MGKVIRLSNYVLVEGQDEESGDGRKRGQERQREKPEGLQNEEKLEIVGGRIISNLIGQRRG